MLDQVAGPSAAEPDPKPTWEDQAREAARKIIVDTEQMKARVESPEGIERTLYSDLFDDEFFHITCHVEEALKFKIEQGKFVDFEKLLVKDRSFARPGGAR